MEKEDIGINPIEKKDELCALVKELGYNYEIHTKSDKDYEGLDEGMICITVPNPKREDPMYIDLGDGGEFTLTFNEWHNHYPSYESDYNRLIADIKGILNNEKCAIIVSSNKKWLYMTLSKTKLDASYDYRDDFNKLPEDTRKELQKELDKNQGKVELRYWDNIDDVTIEI